MKRIFHIFVALSVLTVVCLSSGTVHPLPSPLKILLSNDDGIDAPGLMVLFEKLSSIAQVTVAAPTQNYGGFGHAMTFSDPILVNEFDKKGAKWYAVKATPPTCVRLALDALLAERPDFVISGINPGENTGVDVFYSATVACAREAAFLGIPSIAVSLGAGSPVDYGLAADFIVDLVRALKEKPLKPGTYLNVNVPGRPKEQIKGILYAPQDSRHTLESFDKRTNPRGQVYFWNSFKSLDEGTEKTDVWAMHNGYIAVTPLQISHTDYQELKELERLKIAGWKD